MSYQQQPPGPPQPMTPQPMVPQPMAPQPMAPPGPYGAPATYHRELNAGRATLLLLFLAFALAAVGLLIRYITGFMDPTPGVLKTRVAGTMLFAYGGLSSSLSLLWAAYKVFEGQAVRVAAILGGILMFIIPFVVFGA